MSEYEKNVYMNLFEYPTKHIVELEIENELKDKEINRLNNIINGIDDIIKNHYIVGNTVQNSSIDSILKEIKQLKESDNND